MAYNDLFVYFDIFSLFSLTLRYTRSAFLPLNSYRDISAPPCFSSHRVTREQVTLRIASKMRAQSSSIIQSLLFLSLLLFSTPINTTAAAARDSWQLVPRERILDHPASNPLGLSRSQLLVRRLDLRVRDAWSETKSFASSLLSRALEPRQGGM